MLVSSIEGNGQRLDGGSMFGNVPRAMWSKWIEPDELGRIPLSCRAMLVEWGEYKVLCEVGIGAFFEPKLADRFGVQDSDEHKLLTHLSSLGLQQEDITHVVLSHLHFDHVGGLLPTFNEIQSGNDQLLFPKAKYITSKEAFARAEKPHFRDRASFIPGMVEKLKASQRLDLIAPDSSEYSDFGDRVRFFFSSGHTPGQMHSCFVGEGSSVVFCGDLVPGTPWVHLPVTMGYDRYPEQLIDEKQEFYSQSVEWFFYTHDSDFCCSKIKKNEKGKYEPIKKQKQWVRQSL